MRKLTTEEWIAKAVLKHNNKYDYSQVTYQGSNLPVSIICNKHGIFTQVASQHAKGQGCPSCAIEEKALSLCSTTEEFINKALKIHEGKYDYSNTVYIKSHIPIKIVCPVHGEFNQKPAGHLRGQGCRDCQIMNHTKTTKEFIEEARNVHGNTYDYSESVYITKRTLTKIICSVHGEFEQTPDKHTQGQGCPKCAIAGFKVNKPAYLYYLKVATDSGEELYKIGITNRTVNERFNLTELSKIEIVKQKLYDNGQDALDWEQLLLKQYKEYQYKGPDILNSGNTELFTKDIMSLYYSG